MAPRKVSSKEVKATVKSTRSSARVASQQQKRETAAALVSSIPAVTKTTTPTATKSKKSSTNKVTKTSKTSKSTKMSATSKKSSSTDKKASVASGTNKRKRSSTNDDDDNDSDDEELELQPAKKVKAKAASKSKASAKKVTATTKKVANKGLAIASPIINKAPTQVLECFVFGENGSGELGIGHMSVPGKRVIDVKRPRLNQKLSAEEVGVVQLDCGGMHVVALTRDNKVLTWGVNDQGALGRVTKGGEQYKTIDEKNEAAAEEADPWNSGLNPLESAPAEVDYINIPKGTIFTKVAAGDSITMVLSATGEVYGCGTFRSNEGVLGFSKTVEIQYKLTLVQGLKNIVDLSCGTNHVIALDNKGRAYAFGSGQQNQLGRRIVERTKLNSLVPTALSIPRTKVTAVSTGAYHSFAIDQSGRVWGWGLNSFGQTGNSENAGTDGGAIMTPTLVETLKDQKIQNISGGSTHSIAVNGQGQVLLWGRCDSNQIGQDVDEIPEENFYHDNKGDVNRRLLLVPTPVLDVKDATVACASGDTSIVINAEGKAYSWGFSANYQTGQGTHEDVDEATLIENSAIREEKLVWCGLGGQFGMLASFAKEPKANVNEVSE